MIFINDNYSEKFNKSYLPSVRRKKTSKRSDKNILAGDQRKLVGILIGKKYKSTLTITDSYFYFELFYKVEFGDIRISRSIYRHTEGRLEEDLIFPDHECKVELTKELFNLIRSFPKDTSIKLENRSLVVTHSDVSYSILQNREIPANIQISNVPDEIKCSIEILNKSVGGNRARFLLDNVFKAVEVDEVNFQLIALGAQIRNDLLLLRCLSERYYDGQQIRGQFKTKSKKVKVVFEEPREETIKHFKDKFKMIYAERPICEKNANLFPKKISTVKDSDLLKYISKLLDRPHVEVTDVSNNWFLATIRSSQDDFDYEVSTPFDFNPISLIGCSVKPGYSKELKKEDMALCNLDIVMKIYERVLRNLPKYITDFFNSRFWFDSERWALKRLDGESYANAISEYDLSLETYSDIFLDKNQLRHDYFLKQIYISPINANDLNQFDLALRLYVMQMFKEKVITENFHIDGDMFAEVIVIYQLISSFFGSLNKKSKEGGKANSNQNVKKIEKKTLLDGCD